MSYLLAFIVYTIDLGAVYLIFDSLNAVLGAASLLPLAVLICMGVSFLGLRPKPLKKLRSRDRNAVNDAAEELRMNAELLGIKLPRFRVYFNTGSSVNAFAGGFNAIVVTQGMISQYGHDSRIFASVLAHEAAHIKHGDVMFSAIVTVNFIFLSAALTVSLFGAALLVVLIASVLFSVIFSDVTELYFSGGFGRICGKVVGVLKFVVESIGWAVSAIFFRHQELNADKFSAQLGFAYELIFWLEDMSQAECSEQTFFEELLSTHPSPYTRIMKLEDIETSGEFLLK